MQHCVVLKKFEESSSTNNIVMLVFHEFTKQVVLSNIQESCTAIDLLKLQQFSSQKLRKMQIYLMSVNTKLIFRVNVLYLTHHSYLHNISAHCNVGMVILNLFCNIIISDTCIYFHRIYKQERNINRTPNNHNTIYTSIFLFLHFNKWSLRKRPFNKVHYCTFIELRKQGIIKQSNYFQLFFI